jgi:hypothetical protein
VILDAGLVEPRIFGHCGIVDPGIKAAERIAGGRADPLRRVIVRHIDRDKRGAPAGSDNIVSRRAECVFIAGGQDYGRASGCRHPRSREPDAARRTGDDDALLGERLQLDGHWMRTPDRARDSARQCRSGCPGCSLAPALFGRSSGQSRSIM